MSARIIWVPRVPLKTKTKVNQSQAVSVTAAATYTASRIASTTPETCWPAKEIPLRARAMPTTVRSLHAAITMQPRVFIYYVSVRKLVN